MDSKIYRVVRAKYQSDYDYHFNILRDLLRNTTDHNSILDIDEKLSALSAIRMKMEILDAAASIHSVDKNQSLLFG